MFRNLISLQSIRECQLSLNVVSVNYYTTSTTFSWLLYSFESFGTRFFQIENINEPSMWAVFFVPSSPSLLYSLWGVFVPFSHHQFWYTVCELSFSCHLLITKSGIHWELLSFIICTSLLTFCFICVCHSLWALFFVPFAHHQVKIKSPASTTLVAIELVGFIICT